MLPQWIDVIIDMSITSDRYFPHFQPHTIAMFLYVRTVSTSTPECVLSTANNPLIVIRCWFIEGIDISNHKFNSTHNITKCKLFTIRQKSNN